MGHTVCNAIEWMTKEGGAHHDRECSAQRDCPHTTCRHFGGVVTTHYSHRDHEAGLRYHLCKWSEATQSCSCTCNSRWAVDRNYAPPKSKPALPDIADWDSANNSHVWKAQRAQQNPDAWKVKDHGPHPHEHTPAPTPHPCDDGRHSCDFLHGVCVKDGGGFGCRCSDGYFGDGEQCQKWRVCGPDEQQSKPPTRTADRGCTERCYDFGVTKAQPHAGTCLDVLNAYREQ